MNTTMKNLLRLLALAILGFSATVQTAEPAPQFSHKLHFAEDAGACTDCHSVPDGESGAPRVNAGACGDCHDGDDAKFSKSVTATSSIPFSFPHALHTEAAECADCHANILGGGKLGGRPIIPWNRCKECHAENDVEVTSVCKACHGIDMSKTAPSDHGGGAWMKSHGREAEWRDKEAHGQSCRVCHKPGICKDCHQNRRPTSHNGLWRMRTHGIEAGWAANSCKTCHETGACIQCHKNTRPMNHSGAWSKVHGLAAETRDNRHCTTCHSPGECVACHGR
jgi:hypothetical protein